MKLYEKLDYLAYRIRYEATYLEMKYHLKRVMKGKENNYIKRIRHYDRNIGKSCALARLSIKYNIPIVIPFNSWTTRYTKDIPRYIPKYFKSRLPQTIVVNDYSRGERFDYILIEECIPNEVINNIVIPMVKKGVVGYRNVEML